MKKEHLILLAGGMILGHIILSNISPKYRKFAEDANDAISSISILNLL